MQTGKVWGSTAEVFQKNNVEVMTATIKPKTQCSEHKHEYRYNMFYVLSGEIKIKVWKNDYDLVDITTLKKNESTIVKPGEYHQFINDSDNCCEILEIYWTDYDQGDIIRRNCGGKIND